ncbi:unnamed protein product [Rhizophagus irregularis]|nr:unnamed protein product [Rhizophagus irregularis]
MRITSSYYRKSSIGVKVPIYNQDLESNPPQSVLDFKNSSSDHDAIIISTPEYNYSIPGSIENAIDLGK